MRPIWSRLRGEQEGAVMVIAAVSFTIILLFAGLALDFGRAHLLKAQLQTAVDAAALAGALQVVPMVELELDRWKAVDSWCTDPISQVPYNCLDWERAPSVRVSGTEWDLLRQDGWRSAFASRCDWPHRCDSDYKVVRQWLVLPPTTTGVAEDTFRKNSVWPGGSHGATVRDLRVSVDQVKVEVTAAASMTTPTSFLKLAGINELRVSVTGSAVPVRR